MPPRKIPCMGRKACLAAALGARASGLDEKRPSLCRQQTDHHGVYRMKASPIRSKPVRYFGYALFAALMTGLFLFLLFPSRVVEAYVARRFNQAFPLASMSSAGLRPTFYGLAVDQVEVALSIYKDQPVLVAEEIRIRLRPGDWVKGRLGIDLEGRAGLGKINATFYSNGSKAKVRLHLNGGKIQAPVPVLGVRQVLIQSADLDMTVAPGIVTILESRMICDKGAGSLTGTVFVEKKNPERSRLDLRGRFTMTPQGGAPPGGPVGIALKGLLARPEIRLFSAND